MSDKFESFTKKQVKAAIAHREELLREAKMFSQHSEWRKEAERLQKIENNLIRLKQRLKDLNGNS